MSVRSRRDGSYKGDTQRHTTTFLTSPASCSCSSLAILTFFCASLVLFTFFFRLPSTLWTNYHNASLERKVIDQSYHSSTCSPSSTAWPFWLPSCPPLPLPVLSPSALATRSSAAKRATTAGTAITVSTYHQFYQDPCFFLTARYCRLQPGQKDQHLHCLLGQVCR